LIPGVAISIRHVETGISRTTETNAEGLYHVPYLNPGSYELTYDTPGFKRLVRSNIQVRSTETIRVNVTMEIGQQVESVEVSAASQLLETETSSTGHLIAGETLTTLNTPQMKIQTLLYLMPDVTSSASGMGHVAGQRSRAFNATADGVSAMEPVRGSVSTNRFLATVQHNMAEVKILTTALPAEYGHSGGGNMSITYKSGANSLHGLAEERYVSKHFIHRRWQEPNVRGGPFAFHLMSGTLSGPVVIPKLYNGRNKTFWLAGFQRHHEKASENNNRDVPSPAMYNGDFSFGGIGNPIYDPTTLVQDADGNFTRQPFAGNIIPKSRFNPVANNFIALEPYRPERPRFGSDFIDSEGPHNNLSWDTHYRSWRTGSDFKVDHSFTDNHKLFVRYSNYRHRSQNGRWQVSFANKAFDYRFTPIPINQRQVVLSDS
ncbi:MAG: carboxypeptidase regulatory-like domain-containing protein, partial [bacterium]|nr:carboxypeptidase regulatory-like domain-containing protein [bacterium]